MTERTTAGTPDYPIWAIDTAPGWTLSTGDITRATGVEIPIGAVIEWRDRRGEIGRAFDVRVLASDDGPVLVDWARFEAVRWDGDMR